MKLAHILTQHWERFAAAHRYLLNKVHYRAARAVQSCRTIALGGTQYTCPQCEEQRYTYHSCNHRNCPQCGATDQKEWAAAQETKLLPVPYYMLTITVPSALRSFIYKEQTWFYPLFFQAISSALTDLGHDPKLRGGQIGFTAVLHTWTREMNYHPHLHIIIPGVALSENGQRTIKPKGKKYLFPRRILNIIFRNRIKKLIKERDASEGTQKIKELPDKLWKTPWVVNIKHVGKGHTALRYLARYIFKSALSEPRLLGYNSEGNVRLNCQSSKTGQWKEIILTPDEFLRRWSQHVLPKGLVRVRHYGLLSPAAKKKRARVQELLAQQSRPKAKKLTQIGEQNVLGETTISAEKPPHKNPTCPCCQKEMAWQRDLKPLPLWTTAWEPKPSTSRPKTKTSAARPPPDKPT